MLGQARGKRTAGHSSRQTATDNCCRLTLTAWANIAIYQTCAHSHLATFNLRLIPCHSVRLQLQIYALSHARRRRGCPTATRMWSGERVLYSPVFGIGGGDGLVVQRWAGMG